MLLFYLLTINAAGLLLMLSDKRRAKKKLFRIPEATLLGVALIGGSVGSLLGMYIFRHKTRHLKFILGIPTVLVLQIVLAFLLLN